MTQLTIQDEMLPSLCNLHFSHSPKIKEVEIDQEVLTRCVRVIGEGYEKLPATSPLPSSSSSPSPSPSPSPSLSPPSSPDLTQMKQWGAFLGHAIGDAICLCSEFQDKMQMSITYGAGFIFLPTLTSSSPPFSPGFQSVNDLLTAALLVSQFRFENGEIEDGLCLQYPFSSSLPPQTTISHSSSRSPFEYFLRDTHRIRWIPGDHSDDTDQMLLIGLSHFDPLSFAQHLLTWSKYGFPELGDRGGLGIGSTVMKVLQHPQFLRATMKENKSDGEEVIPALDQAAVEVYEASGGMAAANGAIMRTSILGICYYNQLEKAEELAIAFSRITHVDPRCVASCVVLVRVIALLIQGKNDYNQISEEGIKRGEIYLKKVSGESFLKDFFQHVQASSLQELELGNRRAIGYTFKALGASLYLLRSSLSYVDGMLALAREAGDADTNAACAGPVLGAKYGLSCIPVEWAIHHPHLHWLCCQIRDILGNVN